MYFIVQRYYETKSYKSVLEVSETGFMIYYHYFENKQKFEEIDSVENQLYHRDPTVLIQENLAIVATAFVKNPSFRNFLNF